MNQIFKLFTLTATVALVTVSAAQAQFTLGRETRSVPLTGPTPSYRPVTPAPRFEPIRPARNADDRATWLGDGERRVYGQEPTFGDSRRSRNTSPKDCPGLLCE